MTLENKLKEIRKELMDLYRENHDIKNEKYMKELMGSITKLTKALFYLGAE